MIIPSLIIFQNGHQTIMLPLLKLASDGQEHSIREAIDVLAKHFQLSEKEMSTLIPSGKQTPFANKTHWAKTYLVQAGLFEKTRRGHFRISARGNEILASVPAKLDNKLKIPQVLESRSRSRTLTEISDSLKPQRPRSITLWWRGPWDENRELWLALTGTDEATTHVLGNSFGEGMSRKAKTRGN
jgi:restriction endonuclease Mrr